MKTRPVSFEPDRENRQPARGAREPGARELRRLTLTILRWRKGIDQLKGIICSIHFIEDPAILILVRETFPGWVYSCNLCQIH